MAFELRPLRLVVALALCFIPTYLFFRSPSSTSWDHHARVVPANETLGFSTVLAVSRTGSPRQKELLFAANLTGVEIVIPAQPAWTDADVEGFKSDDGSRISRGSALAWLGHLNALRWFLESGLETALVLEDDVDWDIHLRSIQVPKVARSFRKLVQSYGGYWGDSRSWEIIFLGHCGDYWNTEQWRPSTTVREVFHDNTLPPRSKLHSKTQAFLGMLGLGDHKRVVHRSRWPLCTFGYAVNRASARRILTQLAPREPGGGCQAYDVRLLEGCRDLDYKCYSVNPELFHHIQAPSEIAIVDSSSGTDAQGRLQRENQKKTPNIACGVRSKSLYTEDPDTLRFLRELVGRKGYCLTNEMDEDYRRWP